MTRGVKMTSRPTFRARTLDAGKPMAIHRAEELPELDGEYAINRAVPALPTGMEKEEEAEKHLQDILEAQNKGLIQKMSTMVIPTPEVEVETKDIAYTDTYKNTFKQPRQYIHVQPFNAEGDIPDYDMDEADINFFTEELKERKKFEVSMITFEDIINRLEKNSSQTIVTIKLLRKPRCSSKRMMTSSSPCLITGSTSVWRPSSASSRV